MDKEILDLEANVIGSMLLSRKAFLLSQESLRDNDRSASIRYCNDHTQSQE